MVQPAGPPEQCVIFHSPDGRSTRTPPIGTVPVLFSVRVKTVPRLSFRNWTCGVIDPVPASLRGATAHGVKERIPTTVATRIAAPAPRPRPAPHVLIRL